MINPTKRIKITAIGYITQIDGDECKYDNSNFYVISVSLKRMYKNKYAKKDYSSTLHLFKVEVI